MPSGKNQWTELLASNRRRNKGSLEKLQAKLWHAVQVVEAGMHDAMEQGDSDGVRKWVNCLTQLAQAYSKIVIDSDIEQRIKAIEQRVAGNV